MSGIYFEDRRIRLFRRKTRFPENPLLRVSLPLRTRPIAMSPFAEQAAIRKKRRDERCVGPVAEQESHLGPVLCSRQERPIEFLTTPFMAQPRHEVKVLGWP